jgi:hypothetical protein
MGYSGRSKTSRAKCIACGKVITGKPRVMKLKITSSKPELLESSKKLGFTSTTWQEGDFLQGSLHKKCFDMTIHIWQVAFHTRPVSPRR